jgi:hypothetical protein
MIVQTGKGYSNYGGASVNGTNFSGIEITLRHIGTNEEFVLRSRKNGLFYSVELTEGDYEIIQLYIKKTSGSSWADLYTNPEGVVFTVVKNTVNNIGLIQWSSVFRTGTNISYSKDHNRVRNEFLVQFAKSNWNEQPWMTIYVN